MAGRSVDSAVVLRDNQRSNLLFAKGQAPGTVINGFMKVMEQTGHPGCQAGQANGVGGEASFAVTGSVV